MAKHTLNSLWCLHRKIFKVRSVIFQRVNLILVSDANKIKKIFSKMHYQLSGYFSDSHRSLKHQICHKQ